MVPIGAKYGKLIPFFQYIGNGSCNNSQRLSATFLFIKRPLMVRTSPNPIENPSVNKVVACCICKLDNTKDIAIKPSPAFMNQFIFLMSDYFFFQTQT